MKIKSKFLFLAIIAFLGASCSYNVLEEPIDCTQYNLGITFVSKIDANCGLADGSIEVTASGGTENYTYFINEVEEPASNGSFQELSAGSYIVKVSDGVCTADLMVDILNKNGLNMQVASTDTGCKTNKGSIKINATDGEGAVLYSINAIDFTTESLFEGLMAGTYNVIAKDEVGCEVAQTVILATGVSFTSTVGPIIANSCAVTGCHSGSQSPDLRTFSNIQLNAARIKARTGNGSMPIGSTLTKVQKDAIACWVDDGAKDN